MSCTCDIKDLFFGQNGCKCGEMDKERGGKNLIKTADQVVDGSLTYKVGMYVRAIDDHFLKGQILLLQEKCGCDPCKYIEIRNRVWIAQSFVNSTFYASPVGFISANHTVVRFDTAYPRPIEIWVKDKCNKCYWGKNFISIGIPSALRFNPSVKESERGSYAYISAECGCLKPINYGKG